MGGLVTADTDIIATWRSVKGFPARMTDVRCGELIAKLRADFPDVDLLAASHGWTYYKIENPLKAKSNIALQLRTWMGREKPNEHGRTTTSQRQPTTDEQLERSTRRALG